MSLRPAKKHEILPARNVGRYRATNQAKQASQPTTTPTTTKQRDHQRRQRRLVGGAALAIKNGQLKWLIGKWPANKPRRKRAKSSSRFSSSLVELKSFQQLARPSTEDYPSCSERSQFQQGDGTIPLRLALCRARLQSGGLFLPPLPPPPPPPLLPFGQAGRRGADPYLKLASRPAQSAGLIQFERPPPTTTTTERAGTEADGLSAEGCAQSRRKGSSRERNLRRLP